MGVRWLVRCGLWLTARFGEPPGLTGYWAGLDALTPAALAQHCGPVLARVRALLSRRFARDLLTVPLSTIDLDKVLDGAILLARVPKGELGEDVARLVGALLVSGLWAAATRRSAQPPEHRRDATIIVDEAHSVVHLPISMDDALAEARGYRISLVLAHQHLAQLPTRRRVRAGANARNKIYFAVSPDARHLARHVYPVFDDYDLAARAAFHATIRAIHHGQATRPLSVATLPLPPPVPGRAARLRAAARANAGLTAQQRLRSLCRPRPPHTHVRGLLSRNCNTKVESCPHLSASPWGEITSIVRPLRLWGYSTRAGESESRVN